MKTPQRLRLLLLAALSTTVLMACLPHVDSSEAQAQMPAPSVSVAQVINERITEWDEFTGRLQAPQTVDLRPRVSGYIEKVTFAEGALVSAGDVLFEIDNKLFAAEVMRFKADLDDAESQAKLAQSEMARAKRLKAKNAISQELLDNRVASHQRAAAVVQSRKAALVEAQLNLDYTRVKAPISGRVSLAIITKGNYVTAGQSQLTTLVSTDKIYAYFDADEQTYLKYNQLARNGNRPDSRENKSPVLMGLVGDNDFPYAGHIDFLDNQVNQQTGTIRGRAVFENTDGRFTSGLFARIKVAGSASYSTIMIDDKAIGTDLNNKFVWVMGEGNEVERRSVTLGKKHNGLRVITDGLQPTDTIIISGVQRVSPGALVNPNTVKMADEKVLAKIHRQQHRVDVLQTNTSIAVSVLPSNHLASDYLTSDKRG